MTSTITDRSPLPVPELGHDAIAAETPTPDETATPTVLSLQDVSFYYGAFRAVKDITFDVPTHQITAIIGPSGCGKSTLLRCDQPDERPDPGRPRRGPDHVPRRGHLRLVRRPGGGPPADRDGLPEAEPVPEVDLRQRRRSGRG